MDEAKRRQGLKAPRASLLDGLEIDAAFLGDEGEARESKATLREHISAIFAKHGPKGLPGDQGARR
jgi:hypothetical protein